MKTKILLALFCVFAFSTFAFTQIVKITPKKTIYTRKFKVDQKEKKTFTITYPIVSGTISAAAKKNLENTISYWRAFETSLKENLNEMDWLDEAYFKVNYNKNGVLDISLTQEGVAAYPDSQTVNLVIDLKTGNQIKFNDAFKSDSREKLAVMVDKKLGFEKREIIANIAKEKDYYSTEEDRKNDEQMLEDLKFTAENFDEYSVSDKGVAIFYDAGFPHVIQALQPNGRYFFTWAQIKPFIKRDGLLARFVR
ncbi:MAG TPA: hypothetical protein VGC76_15925 [Pyrinomonadaceae bacterium]|jgi:hypothetical protein